VAWSAWSLREQPFRVASIGGGRLGVLKLDPRNCAAELELAVFVRFHGAPGTIRYEVRLGPGIPVKTLSQKVDQAGSGTDLLGPRRIHLRSGSRHKLVKAEVVIVAPSLAVSRDIQLDGLSYLAEEMRRCGLV
jgi:hypothetical protein